jgi:hypothetical protein
LRADPRDPDGKATASRSRDTSALTTLLLFRGKAAVRTAAVETTESDEQQARRRTLDVLLLADGEAVVPGDPDGSAPEIAIGPSLLFRYGRAGAARAEIIVPLLVRSGHVVGARWHYRCYLSANRRLARSHNRRHPGRA